MKNYLWSTMSQDRLNSLAKLSIESDLTSSLEYEISLMTSTKKSRKKPTQTITMNSCQLLYNYLYYW